ncbi:MAG: PH domain-containing protein [Shewanella sp.]
MSLLNALMGNASAVDLVELDTELRPILADSETIALAYKMVRDLFIFTDKRLILIDKQGVTGKKVSYQSIPYKSITFFEVETAGRFDLDSELKLWISGQKEPLIKELKRGTDVVEIQRTIANFVL